MEDKEYQCLEKKFHLLQEKHLRELCSETDVPYGSAAVICKAIVDKMGSIEETEKILQTFQSTNEIELITSAYFDAEDLEKTGLPIPTNFLNIPEFYVPGQSIECNIQIEEEFATNVTRRDWIGLFEVGWKYLHSYITFEWVAVPEVVEAKNVMVVKFNSRTLPTKPKDEAHVFCYVTRTGDVLGVSPPFHFKNPGISFTDPDTFLIEDDMLTSINQISIDMPSMSAPSLRPEESLNSKLEDSLNSPVICPTFQDIDSAQESLIKEKEQLSIQIQSLESTLEDSRKTLDEKDSTIASLKAEVEAKLQQQETVENENFENLRELERKLTAEQIKSQNLRSLNANLEEKIAEYADQISKHELVIQQNRQQLSDSENVVLNLQQEIFQKSENPDDQLLARYQNLNTEKCGLETALDEMSKQKSQIETLKNNCEEEINKLKVLVKSKDDVINKLVLNKRETDGNVVVLQSEANKQKDEAKRLLNELNACIKQLKESEAELYSSQKKQRQLESDITELSIVRNETKTLHEKVVRLEEKNKELESVRISLNDSEIATGTVLSLRARIAHLEHLSSQYESQLIDAQISMTESVGNVVSAEIAGDIHRLKAELETRDKQMEEVRRRAEEIEINFREGIKDLRGQLVKKTLELEQKNELLADKGEIIDGMRAECQERRENERYTKHRIAQLDKKLAEEAESYHQIIAHLQSQLSGYTNAHIQFDRHGLVKCPFCPAAYERSMQQQMEQHIIAKHPF
ncbi:calcium-binding and coiled-coil domain-containing protein 1-A-like [Bolinopsis microptera]|uniref:calcium-binding and coiled-coil domain-containing protein 1-A-like n=1 Tax=Bolinopsis microptera TaxID=2820187 RepID=UPI00307924B7